MIQISAIICTFKRPGYLRLALQSLCEQTLPTDQYEILVVDNAVQDEAKQVVEEFSRAGINLCYIPEKKVGLSHARNTGIKHAAGEFVAFLDDDARADSRWLEKLLDAFQKSSALAVGGRVWLDWQGEKPGWVPDRHLSLYTYVDHGDSGHQLRNGEYLVGANLAFTKQSLLSLGGFDPNLGRQGTTLLSGEESAVIEHLQRSGETVYYEPSAVVWHAVDATRKRPTWLLRRLFWDGASQPLTDAKATRRSRRATSLSAFRDLRQCARGSGEMFLAMIKGRKSVAWESLLGLSQRVGRLRTEVRMLAWNSD